MEQSTLWLFILLAGFVIGLGAVTVIDLHGFLARKSSYWTEATIRTHKVTKPLIWLGMALTVIGLVQYTGQNNLEIPQPLLVTIPLLISNGLFLTFWVSPRLLKRETEGKEKEILPSSWQTAITVSFLLSVICWWSSLYAVALLLDR